MNNKFPMAAWRAGMDRIEAAKTVDMRFAWTTQTRCHIPTADTKQQKKAA